MINQKLEGNAVAAHRVKLFATTQRGDWDDRGTGFLVPTPDGFRINSETQLCDLLLNHTIRALEYKQQSDNILLWTEPSGTSLAISFQSSAQTRELLEHICNVQRRDSAVIRIEEEVNEVVLPLPTFEALPAIQDILSLTTQKPAVAHAVASGDFLSSLAALFKKAECSKSPSLPHFFAIYKSFGKRYAVLLCDSTVLDLLLSDTHYLTFFGALEYDPDLVSCELRLRWFLTKELTFNNVLNITEAGLLAKVHKAYRVLFLRDTGLARCLDDCTANFLSNHIVYTYTDIINQYVISTELRSRLVALLSGVNFQGFNCLNELCRMAKSIALNTRALFYQSLSEDSCFDLLEKALDCATLTEIERKHIEGFLPEIILSIMQLTPQFIKRYIISEEQQTKGFAFLSTVCRCILNSQEVSALQGMSDLLKALLEPDDSDPVYLELCEVFYDNIIEKMIEKLEVSKVEAEELRICLIEVLQVLTQCVAQPQFRIASFLDKSGVLVKAVRLFEMQDKCLTLAVLKFLRAVISRNDSALSQHIVQHDLLRPAMRVFVANGARENMIFSSMLALIDVIKKAKCKTISEYVVRNKQLLSLEDELMGSEVMQFFQQLKTLRIEEEVKEPETCFSTGDVPYDSDTSRVKTPGSTDLDESPKKRPKLSSASSINPALL